MTGEQTFAPTDVVLLLGLITVYYWVAVRRRMIAAPRNRIESYHRWLKRMPVAFGGSALLALLISGQLQALILLPQEFTPLIAPARDFAVSGVDIGSLHLTVIAALLGASLIGALIARWRAGRGKHLALSKGMARLIPTSRDELGWAAAMGISAGVVEEIYFRLALPLFLTRVTGNVMLAMLVSLAMFVYAHRYQNRLELAVNAIVGFVLAALYLATGDLWLAMLVHIMLNLNALVLRPLLVPRPIANPA